MVAHLAQSVAGRIASYLERAILDGRYKPGDWLDPLKFAGVVSLFQIEDLAGGVK